MKWLRFFLLLFVVNVSSSFSQPPNWSWATSFGGTYRDVGISTVSDASGNVYLMGYFNSSSITFGSTTLNNAGSNTSDMYIVKYDAAGNILWAERFGGTKNDVCNEITTDVSGNVFITGNFKSSSIFFGSNSLSNSGSNTTDIFVAKLNVNGNVQWAKKAGGASDDNGLSIVTDPAGSVYVTGEYMSPSVTFGSSVLTNSGSNTSDMFFTKFDNNGNVVFAKTAGGSNNEGCQGISADAVGNIYVTGYFYSSSLTLGNTTLSNTFTNYSDIFTVKYDSSGNVKWAISAGGADQDFGVSSTCDNNGNLYITANYYSHTINVDTTTFTNAINGSGSMSDILLIKYDSDGNFLWGRNIGGRFNEYTYSSSSATDQFGNFYITGSFTSISVNLGNITLNNADTTGNTPDFFVIKYDHNGNLLWAINGGGTNYEFCYGVSSNYSGAVFVTGYFNSTAMSLGTNILTNSGGNYDVFFAKLDEITGVSSSSTLPNSIVYPNPFSREACLISNIELNNATLKVINVFGQTVMEINEINSNTIPFSRGNLMAGIYYLQLIQNHKVLNTNKVIVVE